MQQYNLMVGLILGRFIPPHNGHIQLINTALAQCKRVYLVLCSLKADAIAPEARLFWIEQLFAREIAMEMLTVIHIDKELPAAAKTKPHAPEIWAGAVTEHIPEHIDTIYTSENYGAEFAHALGAACVQFDHNRPFVPVSASQILADPAQHWSTIPLNVRPYFAQRLYTAHQEARFSSWIHFPEESLLEHAAQQWHLPTAKSPEFLPRSPFVATSMPLDQLITIVNQHNAGIIYTKLSTPTLRTHAYFPQEAQSSQPRDFTTAASYRVALLEHIAMVLQKLYGIYW